MRVSSDMHSRHHSHEFVRSDSSMTKNDVSTEVAKCAENNESLKLGMLDNQSNTQKQEAVNATSAMETAEVEVCILFFSVKSISD